MMFPLYSVSIFLAIFLLVLGLPLKLLFPSEPILLGVVFAVTFQYVAYELWHAVLHLPYERFWKPGMEARWSRSTMRRIYGFHLVHHWRPSANLAIVGFYGIAVWDYAFRTHLRPSRLPLGGSKVAFSDSKLKTPRWPIALLDRWQTGLYKAARSVEKFAGRIVGLK